MSDEVKEEISLRYTDHLQRAHTQKHQREVNEPITELKLSELKICVVIDSSFNQVLNARLKSKNSSILGGDGFHCQQSKE